MKLFKLKTSYFPVGLACTHLLFCTSKDIITYSEYKIKSLMDLKKSQTKNKALDLCVERCYNYRGSSITKYVVKGEIKCMMVL
jgi:hypothetical protein